MALVFHEIGRQVVRKGKWVFLFVPLTTAVSMVTSAASRFPLEAEIGPRFGFDGVLEGLEVHGAVAQPGQGAGLAADVRVLVGGIFVGGYGLEPAADVDLGSLVPAEVLKKLKKNLLSIKSIVFRDLKNCKKN